MKQRRPNNNLCRGPRATREPDQFFSGCLKTFDAGGSSLIQYHHLRLVSRVPTVRAAAGPKVSHIPRPLWCQSITYSVTYVSSGALCQMHEISHIHCRMCHQEHCARCIILACTQNQHGPAIQTAHEFFAHQFVVIER